MKLVVKPCAVVEDVKSSKLQILVSEFSLS